MRGFLNPATTAWIGAPLLRSICLEATRLAPLETGGLMLGFWATAPVQPVITHLVGAGPDAIHERDRFAPDHEYQVAQIDHLCRHSEEALEYLGDWHSHPGAAAIMSGKDRATLATIASTAEARAPRPLMLILGYGPEWIPRLWVYSRRSVFGRMLMPNRFAEWRLQTYEIEP